MQQSHKFEERVEDFIETPVFCTFFFHLGNEFQTPVVSINAIYPLWLALMAHSPAKCGES